jgi:hypothetical protein
MRINLRNAVSLAGSHRVLGMSAALVAFIFGASMTPGAIAGGKPLTPYIAATPVGIRSNPPGAPSAAGIQYISVTAGIAAQNGGGAHGTATCPAGYYVIGGGLSSLGSNIAVSEDAPNPDHTSWSAAIQNNDYSPMPLNVYAICASIG